MKFINHILLVIVIITLYSCDNSAKIAVRVVDYDTNLPVANTELMIVRRPNLSEKEQYEKVLTDENGEHTFTLTEYEFNNGSTIMAGITDGYYPVREKNALHTGRDYNTDQVYDLYITRQKATYNESILPDIPDYSLSEFVRRLENEEALSSYIPKYSKKEIDTLLNVELTDKIINTNVYYRGGTSSGRESFYLAVARWYLVESIKNNYQEPHSGSPLFLNLKYTNQKDTFILHPDHIDMAKQKELFEKVNLLYQNWWRKNRSLASDSLFKTIPIKDSGFMWE